MGQEIAISVTSRVLNGSDAIAFLSPLLPGDAIKERLIVAFLDGSGHILNWIEHPGDECGVDIPLRRIIAHALAHDAHGLLLAHNHPSGDPTPSAPDVEVTRQLAAAAHPLGLVVHDHLIRAADEWRSLTAMALI